MHVSCLALKQRPGAILLMRAPLFFGFRAPQAFAAEQEVALTEETELSSRKLLGKYLKQPSNSVSVTRSVSIEECPLLRPPISRVHRFPIPLSSITSSNWQDE